MKKIIALLLTMSLLTCTGINALAVDDNGILSETEGTLTETVIHIESFDESTAAEEPETVDVSDTTEATETTEADEYAQNDYPMPIADPNYTYNVEISWVGMTFTYHEATLGEWSTDTMRYEGATEARWTSSDGDKTYGTITVTNNSTTNSPVDVTFSFTKERSIDGTLLMRFSQSTEDVNTTDNYYPDPCSVRKGTSLTMYVVPGVGTSFDLKQLTSEGVTLGTIKVEVKVEKITDPPMPEGPEIFD